MVVANVDDADGGDLSEVHGAIRKTWHRILGWRNDQPKSPGEMKGVLTRPVGLECMKTPRQ
jgi:hypothetical protein